MTTRTPYPIEGYSRPASISPLGLIVKVYGETGELLVDKDFNRVQAPAGLVNDLVHAFVKATGSDGRWRSKATVQNAASFTGRFATDIARGNPKITSMREFSAEMWWQWRIQKTERTRWPGQVNMARCLLYEVDSLPDTTRRALAARTKKPKNRLYQAYSIAEYRRIYAAAWRNVRHAKQRLYKNHSILQQYHKGQEPNDNPRLLIRKKQWSKGQVLDYMMVTGCFPDNSVPEHRNMEFKKLFGITEHGAITQAIFASTNEIFSLLILFACERGFNLSVMNGLTADPFFADIGKPVQVITVHALDKPRRGPAGRYSSVSLAGKAARIWKFAHEITQPARDYFTAISQPTDALLLGRVLSRSSVDGLFKRDWTECRGIAKSWQKKAGIFADDGTPIVIDFRRLRLTEQVINQQANQNSEAVSESIYRRPDPYTQEMARETILHGQLDAVFDASALVTIRSLQPDEIALAMNDPSLLADKLGVSVARTKQLLKGNLDTATVACIDFMDSPFVSKGSPCTATFLKCFSCKNAVATPGHLPRLVTLLNALDEIASAVSESVWLSDYKDVRAQLSILLTQYATEPELQDARSKARADDVKAIKALLKRKFDV